MPVSAPTDSVCRTAARCLGLALAALLAAALSAPSALAAPAGYAGASADGGTVFFTSTEKLVPGDTDTRRDVYQRSFDAGVGTYVTRQLSTGPAGGNDAFDAFFERASADGAKIFVSTDESLVSADTDQQADVYLRDLAAGTTTLVTQGDSACAPACGNGAFAAGFAGIAPDGTAAFFVTAEQLGAGDADSAVDVYERDLRTNSTAVVSTGGACAPACGNGAFNATFRGVSADGSTAFFVTSEQLETTDTDTASDLYARALPGGPTTHVSAGGNSNSSAAVFAGSSADGATVFFETDEGLTGADTDGSNDVYQRAGGVTTLISDGALPGFPANFMAASGDGSRVFFVSAESLAGGDVNAATDVYQWQGGAPSLVTSGTCCGSTFGAVTADGTRVVFTTTERLDAADTDSSADVYEQIVGGGAPALASEGSPSCAPGCGNGPAAAIFNRVSADGSQVFFTTEEPLVTQDLDADADIYSHDLMTSTTTLSTPPPGLCPVGSCDAIFNGASEDAAHVFFQTEERLDADDVDSEIDVYERAGGQTRLVSTGNSVALGPATPVLTGTNPASPGASTSPAVVGQSDPNTSIKLYTTPDCSGVPAATGTSAELGGAGIAVAVAAGSTTSFRATATDSNGDTSDCSGAVSYTQQSAPPPPPPDPGPGSGGTGGGGSTTGGGSAGTPKPGNVVYLVPHTRITFAPGIKTRARKPVFRFTDSTGQEGTRFFCKVDRRPWRPCGSPTKLKKLKRGKHVFRVRAVNAAGEWEPAPVKRKFKLVSG